MSNYYDHTLTVTKYNIAELSELVDFITEPEAVPDLAFAFTDAPHLDNDNEITFYGVHQINWGIDNTDMYKRSSVFGLAMRMATARRRTGKTVSGHTMSRKLSGRTSTRPILRR